jgi:hypothetical protein
MTILYLIPVNPLYNSYSDYVGWYMNPIFTQSWELFGRQPLGSYKALEYKCENEKYAYLFSFNVLSKHEEDRLVGNGKAYYLFKSIINDIASDIEDYKKLQTNKHLKIVRRLLNTRCNGVYAARLIWVLHQGYSKRKSHKYKKVILKEF